MSDNEQTQDRSSDQTGSTSGSTTGSAGVVVLRELIASEERGLHQAQRLLAELVSEREWRLANQQRVRVHERNKLVRRLRSREKRMG